MFRVVLEEVGCGVKPCDLTTPLCSIQIYVGVLHVCLEFPSGVRVYRQPGGICEGQAISQHSKPRTKLVPCPLQTYNGRLNRWMALIYSSFMML